MPLETSATAVAPALHPAAVQPLPAAAVEPVIPIAASAAVAAAAPVAQAPPAPVTPAKVEIPLDQLNALYAVQTRLAQFEKQQAEKEAAAQQEHIKILAQKGQIEDALKMAREESEKAIQAERAKQVQTEDRAKKYALDGELGRALSSHQLVTGGAEHLTTLLRNDFTVEARGDSFEVRSKDYKSVGDYIGAMLGRPEYSCFVRAQNPAGGVGANPGTSQTAPTPTAPAVAVPVEAKNLGHAIALNYSRPNSIDGRFMGESKVAVGDDGREIVKAQAAAGFGLRPLSRS